jgi:hypothetical protein
MIHGQSQRENGSHIFDTKQAAKLTLSCVREKKELEHGVDENLGAKWNLEEFVDSDEAHHALLSTFQGSNRCQTPRRDCRESFSLLTNSDPETT